MTKHERFFDTELNKLLGDREPLEVAREVFVYAPIGLASRLSKDFPDLVQEGKQRFSMAKVLGTFAAQQGRRQFEDKLRNAAESFLGDMQGKHPEPESETVRDTTAKAKAQEPAADADGDLPIPRYDTLPASQVLSHLSRLTREQRQVIADYEAVNRNRRTILNRIAQLNASE